MNHTGPTIIKRGGFLSALAYGLFGFLTVTVVCASGLAFYGLRIADHSAADIISTGGNLIESLPQWSQKLPPLLADALADRRTPAYRDQVDLDVQLTRADNRHQSGTLVINASNRGDQTISLMSVRVVLVDENGVPFRSESTYAVTPVTIDPDWRGPLLPDSTRHCALPVRRCPPNLTPVAEITDLRLWDATAARAPVDG